MLDHFRKSLRSGGRLVVLDGFPDAGVFSAENGQHHGLAPASVEDQLRRQAFDILDRRDKS
jgi:hypothetical protein